MGFKIIEIPLTAIWHGDDDDDDEQLISYRGLLSTMMVISPNQCK